MKGIIIRSQTDFDALPQQFEEYTQIGIVGDIGYCGKELIKSNRWLQNLSKFLSLNNL